MLVRNRHELESCRAPGAPGIESTVASGRHGGAYHRKSTTAGARLAGYAAHALVRMLSCEIEGHGAIRRRTSSGQLLAPLHRACRALPDRCGRAEKVKTSHAGATSASVTANIAEAWGWRPWPTSGGGPAPSPGPHHVLPPDHEVQPVSLAPQAAKPQPDQWHVAVAGRDAAIPNAL